MKDTIEKNAAAKLLGNKLSPGPRNVAKMLKSWSQSVGCYSMFMALPVVIASTSQEVRADNGTELETNPRPAERIPSRPNKSCRSSLLLNRRNDYFLPHQKGRYDIVSEFAGRDDCPGIAIPDGTYTVAAPFSDSGDTSGANNTVSYAGDIGYCYYGFSAPGPDHVYTFTLSGRTNDARIEVTPGNAAYLPVIYVLDGRLDGSCPSGTGNTPCSALTGAGGGTQSGQVALDRAAMFRLPLNVPLHLFIDGRSANSGGPYTIRMQGVTLKTGPRAKFDFDADNRADLSVYRPSEGSWFVNRRTGGFSATQFGLASDLATPADYDGDGKTDIAVFRDGTWYWLNSSTGAFNTFPFGLSGDRPQPADFDGDGRAELAVFRDGTWYTYNLATGQAGGLQFGAPGDIPLVGDYDGDGRSDHAVFRNGTWYMQQSLHGFVSLPFGLPGDRPVPADYDGDSIIDQAVFRGGIWFVRHSLFDFVESFRFGLPTDALVPGDYNGNSIAEAAVYRDGVWYIKPEYDDGRHFSAQRFGLSADRPLPAAYLP